MRRRQAFVLRLSLAATVLASASCASCDPINAPPPNAIADVLAAGGPPADKQVLVLMGDSITQGTVGYRWATDVGDALGDDWFVVNAGTNGEIAWELAERTDDVIACDPDVVTVLIGTNDVMANYDPEFGQMAVDDRGLPQVSDVDFYREHLDRLTQTLLDETDARIGLLSVPTLGEDPSEDAWALAETFADVAREVATERGVAYGPLFETMVEALDALPTRETPAVDDGWLELMTEGIFRHQLGESWDAIGESRGFYLHTDHLHLDEDGGALVEQLVLDIVLERVGGPA
jgi:lysophospholipase L1-like esterase